jgi:hypothetical protein
MMLVLGTDRSRRQGTHPHHRVAALALAAELPSRRATVLAPRRRPVGSSLLVAALALAAEAPGIGTRRSPPPDRHRRLRAAMGVEY